MEKIGTGAEVKKMETKVSLGALFKHEMVMSGRSFGGVLGVQAILVVLEVVCALVPAEQVNWMIRTVQSLGIAALVGCVFLVLHVFDSTYRKTLHGEYAYFTASIPVKMRMHYAVKVACAIIATCVSVVFSLFGVWFGVASMSMPVMPLSEWVRGVAGFIGEFPMIFALIVCGLLWAIAGGIFFNAFVETLSASGSFARAGKLASKIGTTVLAVVIFFGGVILFSAVVPFGLFFSPTGMWIEYSGFFQNQWNNGMPLGGLLYSFVAFAIFVVWTTRVLERKLNL